MFTKFLDQGKFAKVSVDNDQADSIVKVLDSVVILLEGGTDFDLQVRNYTWYYSATIFGGQGG